MWGLKKPPPFHELLFTINYNLCKEFPGYTPTAVDGMPYVDVIELYSNIMKIQIKQRKEFERKLKNKKLGIEEKKYIPARDNSW